MNITAAVTDGQGSFTVDTLEIDPPQAGEVLIAIKASGVCHTDWDSLRWGKHLILGHEGAGEVIAVGPGVTQHAPGDRVMLNWAIPCGRCFQCSLGNESICETRGVVPDERYHYPRGPINASFSLGTMATHAIVPQAAVLKLPFTVPYSVAAIMGCAVMTGFGSAVNSAQVSEGSTVVVLGCGGVGLSTIFGALYRRAARVIAVDINPPRLALAAQFGATDTVLADAEDHGLLAAAQQVKRMNGGRGADYAFECTAVPELAAAPLAMVRSAGTAVGVSGIEQVVPIDMELFEWNKLYINPLYGACSPQRDFPLLINLYPEGILPLDTMVSRTYMLHDLIKPLQTCGQVSTPRGYLSLIDLFHTIEISDPQYEHDGLRTVTVKSRALQSRADATVWVPGTSESRILLVLLHGVYGSHWLWSHKGGAHRLAQSMLDAGTIQPMVIIMPGDGLQRDGTGYLSSPQQDIERWIVEEVPAIAHLAAPALADDAQLAIAGLSMGGYGALRLGAKYADRFFAISAHSSITEIDQMKLFTEEPLSDYNNVIPREELSPLYWFRKHRSSLPRLRFDCGVDDPLLDSNRALHLELEASSISHNYQEFPGGHQWPYWQTHLAETLRFVAGARSK